MTVPLVVLAGLAICSGWFPSWAEKTLPPHDTPGVVASYAAFYEEKCQSCHSGRERSVSSKLCPVNRDGGCVNCHMSRDSESMLHVTFTDHFIRILKDKKQREAAASGDQE